MDKKNLGAWLIHHLRKLEDVRVFTKDYDHIEFAGKCGILLNAITRSKDHELEMAKVETLARANGISTTTELPVFLSEFERQRLIEKGEHGISTLGLTSNKTLEHTATIFDEKSPSDGERAVIEFAEVLTDHPISKTDAKEFLSDNFKLPGAGVEAILTDGENFGFFDAEIESDSKLYFNGNLFRRDEIKKANAVLASLNAQESSLVTEFTQKLRSAGCISQAEAKRVLGAELYQKLCSIGFFDENSIVNEKGSSTFITRPASFCKFTKSTSDDAFDHSKALVSSLTYGITASHPSRGRISLPTVLIQRLIDGGWVGPATAIGRDYRFLETRGVVELKHEFDQRYSMRLLKPEVGMLALSVINEGDASSDSIITLPSVSASSYIGPEQNRVGARKKQSNLSKKALQGMLSILRTGG